MKRFAIALVGFFAGSLAGCSQLTEPNDITVTKDESAMGPAKQGAQQAAQLGGAKGAPQGQGAAAAPAAPQGAKPATPGALQPPTRVAPAAAPAAQAAPPSCGG